MATGTFVYIWAYDVSPDKRDAFCDLYGPGGAWVELFRRAPGYVDTWLLADVDRVGRFVTVDRWESRESFDNFRSGFAREFDALDQLGQQLTSGEMLLGEFSGPASSS